MYSSRGKSAKAEPVVFSRSRPTRPARTSPEHDRAIVRAGDLERGHAPVVVAAMEEHRRSASKRPSADGHQRGVEADLLARDAQALHLRVRLEEPPAQEEEPPLQRRAVEVQRLAMDEVLHRVGGHDVRVVALRVGPREGLAHDLDVDLGGEHVVAAAR